MLSSGPRIELMPSKLQQIRISSNLRIKLIVRVFWLRSELGEAEAESVNSQRTNKSIREINGEIKKKQKLFDDIMLDDTTN